MTLPAELAAAALDRILAHVDGLTRAEDRDLTSPMSPGPVGRIRIWRGSGPVVKVVTVALVVPPIGLDSHMIFAVTAPDSAVPHFTVRLELVSNK